MIRLGGWSVGLEEEDVVGGKELWWRRHGKEVVLSSPPFSLPVPLACLHLCPQGKAWQPVVDRPKLLCLGPCSGHGGLLMNIIDRLHNIYKAVEVGGRT